MKKILTLLLVLFMAWSFVAAQNGNGNNGAGNGNGVGSGQYLITWLENGGQIPQALAVAVVIKARDWGQQNFGLSLGQMLQKYNQGLLTVEFAYTSPPSLTFIVRYGGGQVIITIEIGL